MAPKVIVGGKCGMGRGPPPPRQCRYNVLEPLVIHRRHYTHNKRPLLHVLKKVCQPFLRSMSGSTVFLDQICDQIFGKCFGRNTSSISNSLDNEFVYVVVKIWASNQQSILLGFLGTGPRTIKGRPAQTNRNKGPGRGRSKPLRRGDQTKAMTADRILVERLIKPSILPRLRARRRQHFGFGRVDEHSDSGSGEMGLHRMDVWRCPVFLGASFFTKKDNHQVPWDYGIEAMTTTGTKVEPEETEIRRMTRSGRRYTPEELELIRKKSKEKMDDIPLQNDATKKAITGE
ncbi:hypothetical protein Acr_00g0009330 [Actinidia rufa]|uniref:Uncharacterized protein n=1 Tax=Actinidia rufa TaxID=165716 RepID=A0A7J0DAP4_9ERIC|nr:hypothetical protein Acr_00g0009330 [Actinidia rufa]